jgi:uncharacterized protein (DUF58 family)
VIRTVARSPERVLDPFPVEEPEAHSLAARMPALLVEAQRVAHTVTHGTHGRRRAGPGETFWQFRHFDQNDSLAGIDWRRSASSDHLFVREREWEAAHTVWILGTPPFTGRNAARRVAEALVRTVETAGSQPPQARINRFSECLLFSDFLEPVEETSARLEAIAAQEVRGHLVQVLDPAEETLPYAGRTEFSASEGGDRVIAGRAETLRERYQARLKDHRAALAALAKRLGWSFTVHHTDRPAEEVVLAMHTRLAGLERDYRFRPRRTLAATAMERDA